MWVIVQISCIPHSEDNYPIPSRLDIVKIFPNQQVAAEFWGAGDLVHSPPPNKQGQEVYHILWNLGEEPLRLDRYTSNDNKAPSIGDWLPESKQVRGEVAGQIEVQPVPAAKLLERERRKKKLQRVAGVSVGGGTRQASGGQRGQQQQQVPRTGPSAAAINSSGGRRVGRSVHNII